MSINEKMKKYLNQQIQKEKKRTQELQELLQCKEELEKYKKKANEDEKIIQILGHCEREEEYLRLEVYRLGEKEKENDKLKNQVLDLQQEIQKREIRIDFLMKEIRTFERDINELEATNQNLQAQIEQLRKKKIHKKIITFSPLSSNEIRKISQE